MASVATPILGKLGDQYGKERLLVISLALFFIGSVGAAAAWNIWSLIGWRAVQGAGAAVFPLSYGIIRDEFPREKVGVAIGLVSAVFGIGGGFGIVLSGVIVDHVSWRWLFIVGAVGIGAALVLVHRFIPESPIKTPSRVDYLGATLMSGGLIAMLVALTEGENWGWTSGRTLGLPPPRSCCCSLWGVAELHVDDPMVDMRMLARREILFTNITALIAGFAMFGTFVLVPNFVEMPHGLSASVRHAWTTASTQARQGGALPAAELDHPALRGPARRADRATDRLQVAARRRHAARIDIGRRRWPTGTTSRGRSSWPWPCSASASASPSPLMATLITEAVRPTETGVATGMNTVMRTVGGVIGGQVGAALLAAHTTSRNERPVSRRFPDRVRNRGRRRARRSRRRGVHHATAHAPPRAARRRNHRGRGLDAAEVSPSS